MANANFTPDIGPYTQLKPFRFWCQKVLPLVYDDSLSYYELLGKVVDYLNKTMEDVDTQITDIQGLLSAYEALQGWVNAYYTSADFAAAIDDGLDRMAEDGRLDALMRPLIDSNLPELVYNMLPDTVSTLLPDEVSNQIGGTVQTQLPGVVSNQIGGTVATQLPGVVSNQIGGTVANQLPAVVSNQIGPVVEDKIVDPVEDWLDANVSGGIAVDRTLSVLGAGADAAFTGARLESVDNAVGYEHVADTGFFITTTEPYAFNYEYITDNAEFSDHASHTYKMMVIPVNTGDKYCINAHKISIAGITEDHFAVTYGFCAKHVGDPQIDIPYYLTTTYSENDAENVIATVPEITIPTGQGYDETTGYLVVITANIEDPVYKVVDEGIRKDVNDLKSDLSQLYADEEFNIVANSYWPYEGTSAGVPTSYNGWSRTDRLPCVAGETLKISTTISSPYNVFFNTNTDGDVNSHFNLSVGDNEIVVPQGASFYALSNTTSGMNSTNIKKIINGTYVNNGIKAIDSLDEAINGIKTNITYQTPTSDGYYHATVGNTITVSSGSGNYFPAIDLSAYAGQKVRVAFDSTGSTSTRATALCDANGVVAAFVEEKDIVANGYAEFDIGNTFNRLYVSYNASGHNLKIITINGGLLLYLDELPLQCVYVSENGDDANDGSETAPFATIQKAINSGALIVKVEAGSYKSFTIRNRKTPIKIMLKSMPSQYDAQVAETPKIVITTDDTSDYYGVYAVNCSDIYLSDLWVNGSAYDSYMFNNVSKIECVRCWCCDTTDTNSMGFRITNCNGVFRDCKAWDISKDGFNIHLYGDTQFINCEAHNCGDDGISHHEGCNGVIIGGEFYNCVKGGIASPYGGCNVNIYNAYSHNNRFGIYSQSGEEHNKSKGIMSGCVIKNNTEYDINIAKSDIVGWNNIYDTKVVDSTGSFTEF